MSQMLKSSKNGEICPAKSGMTATCIYCSLVAIILNCTWVQGKDLESSEGQNNACLLRYKECEKTSKINLKGFLGK